MSNLLHISANTYPPLYGQDHHTKKIWRELAKGFDEYHILARSEDNSYKYSSDENIHLHLIPRIVKKSRIFFITSFWMFYVIRKYKISHLLAQCPIVGGFAASLASNFYKIPLMVEIHGDVYFKYMKKESLVNHIYSKIVLFSFTHATKIRSLSSAMTIMLANFGISGEKVVIIPNRVNLKLFENIKRDYNLHSPIRLISIGRFVEQKGYDIAIETVKNLSENYNIELYLVGGGELYESLKVLADERKNIHLIKWVKQSELKILLDESDIYIQPSKPFYGEAMPRTILEAMAMRLPVIATNIAAIPGIIVHGKNGILVEPNSIEQLTSAVESLINNLDLREEVSECAYSDIRSNYEWSKVFQLYRQELKTMEFKT